MPIDDIAAVILYDEIASGFRAKDFCDRLALGLAAEAPVRVSLWRTDMLKVSTESKLALAEAATAHFIILALQNTWRLSNSVREWLEKWAKARLVEDAALVVLSRGSEDVFSAMAAHPLREFAASHGLKCFCQSEQTSENPPGPLFVNPNERLHSTSRLPPIPERPDRFAHWGLND